MGPCSLLQCGSGAEAQIFSWGLMPMWRSEHSPGTEDASVNPAVAATKSAAESPGYLQQCARRVFFEFRQARINVVAAADPKSYETPALKPEAASSANPRASLVILRRVWVIAAKCARDPAANQPPLFKERRKSQFFSLPPASPGAHNMGR